ncbi:MAG: hypothetical protein KC731_10250, partial [Myxococcales bacterium]|nr:hypothetical protein [Myxococcales bacterium]
MTSTATTEPKTMTKEERKPIRRELLDELLADYKSPDDLIGENGLLKELTRALVSRAMSAEMSEHLGHDH